MWLSMGEANVESHGMTFIRSPTIGDLETCHFSFHDLFSTSMTVSKIWPVIRGPTSLPAEKRLN